MNMWRELKMKIVKRQVNNDNFSGEIKLNTLYTDGGANPKRRSYRVFYNDISKGLCMLQMFIDVILYKTKPNGFVMTLNTPSIQQYYFGQKFHEASLQEFINWTEVYNNSSLEFDVEKLVSSWGSIEIEGSELIEKSKLF